MTDGRPDTKRCQAKSVNFQGEEFCLECDLNEHIGSRHYFVENTVDRDGRRVSYTIQWWVGK